MSENFDNPYVDALERIQRQDAEIAKAKERIAKLEAGIDAALTANQFWSDWGSVDAILKKAKGGT